MPNGNGKHRRKNSAHLSWDTKPRRAANPRDVEFQTAEIVLCNGHTAGHLPQSFRDGLLGETEIDKQRVNRLIWGDNLLAMQALLAQGYEGKITLIYIDPPFDSKADYSHRVTIDGSEVTKEPSIIERLAYKDTWTGGTDSYLDMIYPRLQLMKRLLSEDGSIWVHLDHNVAHYIKILLDEVFGKENFLNHVTWRRQIPRGMKAHTDYLPFSSDHIFLYGKSRKAKWNPILLERKITLKEAERKYRKDERGFFRTSDPGTYSDESIIRLHKEGRIHVTHGGRLVVKNGKVSTTKGTIGVKYYRRQEGNYVVEESVADNIWDDIPGMGIVSQEWVGYYTQKPCALLERIIKASTDEGQLVADFFCGSGTTGVVAERLGRPWVMCELGKVGIQVARTRLVEDGAKPFLIENIGSYQREMIYLTGGRIWEMQHLILRLYGATPRDRVSGLGVRNGNGNGKAELVYVGYPDRPVTAKKVEELVLQAQNMDGRGYKRLVILGWDYEYNYRQALESRLAARNGKARVQVESRDIPPDIYGYLRKAQSEDDVETFADKVHFYERPYLKIGGPKVTPMSGCKIRVEVSLDRYVLMDIPISQLSKKGEIDYASIMKLAKDNFAVLIDYWAVDWDYDGCTFKSQWQVFRGNGRNATTVPTVAAETLEKKNRTVAVRVVDIFGSDAGVVVKI